MREFLEDENGKFSSTRLVLMIMTVVFVLAACRDVYTDSTIDSHIYMIIQTVFGFGLGGQAVRTTVKNWKGNEE